MSVLEEVGKVLSTANETKVRAAIVALQNVIDSMGSGAQEAAIAEASKALAELSEATWDTAYVNNLPDSAFLYVAPGGKKDSGGLTMPRALRYFPVYDDGGKVDVPHLRNALARIPQSTLDQAVKDAAIAKAQALAKKNLPSFQASDRSGYSDMWRRLSEALQAKVGIGGNVRIIDVQDDFLIYEAADRLYQLDNTSDEAGKVTVGEPFEVKTKTVYEPVEEIEGDVIQGDFVQLEEKAISKDGTAEIKIIQPGWGSSGYYSKEMLTRDASVYAPGTHMYIDHPTESEDKDRPERSIRDLAGELVTKGTYEENGTRGPGIYAKAKVFEPYKAMIEELAPHIGVSHRALGQKVEGEAEGKKGPIIEKLVAAQSVDYITKPGAGGEVVQMFESARGKAYEASKDKEETHIEEVDLMDEVKEKRLTELEEAQVKWEEAKTKLEEEKARLAEAAILREARDIATEKVGASDLPEITQKRLVETLATKPVIKEGALDKAEFEKVIDEAIKAEVVYVAELTKSGKITGMGGSGSTDGPKQLEESFKRRFLGEGYSEEVATKMAKEATQGR